MHRGGREVYEIENESIVLTGSTDDRRRIRRDEKKTIQL